MLARMADAGFSPAELVALLASHSIANVVRLFALLYKSKLFNFFLLGRH